MTPDGATLAILVAKDQIRDLVLLYSRGVDRQDMDLLVTLYASDATDTHGDRFNGSGEDYLASSPPAFRTFATVVTTVAIILFQWTAILQVTLTSRIFARGKRE